MKHSYFFVALFLLLILLFVGLGANFAYAGIGLTIEPIRVSHTIEPGDSVSGVINLKNASNSKIKVNIESTEKT